MKTRAMQFNILKIFFLSAFIVCFISCSEDDDADEIDDTNGDNEEIDGDDDNSNGNDGDSFDNSDIVFLLIDEDAIDNGNEPNNFSETDVNDNIAEIGQRAILDYFQDNIGETIDLYSGQVGDEGFFAPSTIPDSWISAGPTNSGLQNYLTPGPGLGAEGDDPEVLLDEIPDVIPLRATGLKMLEGETVYVVVYDSDISINYDPIEANLQGDNLGIVAFDVLSVTERTNGSSSDLPVISIRIRDAEEIGQLNLGLFSNAPVPESSSEPFDVEPPAGPESIEIVNAS
ncbi:hypothetical protein MKO06_13725 [Gramella sp. GC03-9]|uniref:Uncharacterized protein n=1 Tax=Christiangramia oceanisediminis TaxID=2920386 RepID=A0A9X2KZ10_9FLAO|nr:hypothetical protein [Gramella oceanisediminis]MCP9200973.1 hypothetical protein [Gramella oceanisediminis]